MNALCAHPLLVRISECLMLRCVCALFCLLRRRAFCRLTLPAMTANAMKGDKEACFLAGMDDYLSKPLEFPVVVEKLALWAGRTLELKSVQLLAKESDRRRSTEGTAEGSTGPAAATV